MRLLSRNLALIALPLLAVACATTPADAPAGASGAAQVEVKGTVERVDAASRTITLTATERGGSVQPAEARTTIHYDEKTTLTYRGRAGKPENLEPGDKVSLVALDADGRLTARSIEVTADIRQALSPTAKKYANAIRGTIREIDTTQRRIVIDRGMLTADIITVEYEAETQFERDGEPRTIQNFRRGDEIDVNVRSAGGRLVAESINIVSSIEDPPPARVSNRSDLRGIVRSVNVRERRIELDEVTWGVRAPNRATGEIVTVIYEEGLRIEVAGRSYSPRALERGDVIDVQVRDTGTDFVAEQIWLVRNARQFP